MADPWFSHVAWYLGTVRAVVTLAQNRYRSLERRR